MLFMCARRAAEWNEIGMPVGWGRHNNCAETLPYRTRRTNPLRASLFREERTRCNCSGLGNLYPGRTNREATYCSADIRSSCSTWRARARAPSHAGHGDGRSPVSVSGSPATWWKLKRF